MLVIHTNNLYRSGYTFTVAVMDTELARESFSEDAAKGTTPPMTETDDGRVNEKRMTDDKRRRSTVTGPALDVLQQIETADPHHPIHWPVFKKWWIVLVYCILEVFVTLTSTSYVSIEYLIQERFGGSTQVLTLGQSMYIVGNAIGPAFLGPLSFVLSACRPGFV